MRTGIEAVEPVPSRNAPKILAIQPSGCPRCGARLDGTYKYCPSCSYRLRPDLARALPPEAKPTSTSHRLLALGGFLGFCALLLSVVLTGMRLFGAEAKRPAAPQRSVVFEPRDVRLTSEHLHDVSWGEVAWGVYRPGGLTGPLAKMLRSFPEPEAPSAERAALVNPILDKLRSDKKEDRDAAFEALELMAVDELAENQDLRTWAVRALWGIRFRSSLQELGRAVLPDIYRIDDEFMISVSEVSQEQWFAFLVARARESGKPTPEHYIPRTWRSASGDELVPRMYSANLYDHPVTDIDPAAALEFCNWIWQEQLGADPDRVVDLPTDLEMARAGRGGYDNFPWGAHLSNQRVVLSQKLRPVRDTPERRVVGYYRGVYGLVGNAAEWIHFGQPGWEGATGIAAAGWSYLDSARRRGRESDVWQTPFSSDDLESGSWNGRADHIGFRFVVRRAPARPTFVRIEPGPVQFVARTGPVIRPREYEFIPVTDDQGNVVDHDVVSREVPRVELPASECVVLEAFGIAANEITYRQYLAFLVDVAETESPEELDKLLPRRFKYRPHPLATRDIIFRGIHGDPAKVPFLYPPGRENLPVRGISLRQAEAYAAWLSEKTGTKLRLPTAAQFIRAGRRDADTPYPWGKDTELPELICDGRADDMDRSASLYRFLDGRPEAVAGLCGNLLELVKAPGEDNGYWLAGGCYEFPPDGCTLDDFLLLEWDVVHLPIEGGENPLATQDLTGFRLVREVAEK
jgi:formylglycine-generating enzyme required for sulfatase activity